MSLQEMERTTFNDNSTPMYFQAEAVNTVCHLQNKIYIRPILNKTPYELWNERKPNISQFHPFGCQCFILSVIMEYCLVILKLPRLTEFTTLEPYQLKKLSM